MTLTDQDRQVCRCGHLAASHVPSGACKTSTVPACHCHRFVALEPLEAALRNLTDRLGHDAVTISRWPVSPLSPTARSWRVQAAGASCSAPLLADALAILLARLDPGEPPEPAPEDAALFAEHRLVGMAVGDITGAMYAPVPEDCETDADLVAALRVTDDDPPPCLCGHEHTAHHPESRGCWALPATTRGAFCECEQYRPDRRRYNWPELHALARQVNDDIFAREPQR